MTIQNWLKPMMFLLMLGGLITPTFGQGTYKSLCDDGGCAAPPIVRLAPRTSAGCATGDCATGNGCATGSGCATTPSSAYSAGAGTNSGCADAGCQGECGNTGCGIGKLFSRNGSGCADAGCASLGGGCADSGCGHGGGKLAGLAGLGSGDGLLSGWKFGSWLQYGYHTENNGQFNSYEDRSQIHQAYAYLEKVADGSNGIGFGGRIDYLYGTDAQDTQAFGGTGWDNSWDNGGAYGHAIPQLYGEVALGEVSIKAGHFYSLVGYEKVTSPDNFFYSRSFTMYNAEPFTHTGILATAPMGDVTVYGGWVQGWDTAFDDNGGNQLLTGLSVNLTDNLTGTYIVTAGDIGNGTDLAGYSHSVVFDAKLSENLNYVLQNDYVDYNSDTGVPDRRAFGVNQYLLMQLNEKLAIGTRLEYWQTEVAPGDTQELYNWTIGANIRMSENVVTRPEIRWNRDSGGVLGLDQDIHLGIDTIITLR